MRILALDSCGKTVSVAVYDDGIISGEVFINTRQTHSITLLPSVEWLLGTLELKPAQFDYVAATLGPGSFTGVRIGMAAAKGIAAGVGIKCIGVSSLFAAAYAAKDADAFVCAVMDARCDQVYNANFNVYNNEIERLCDDRALGIDELADELRGIKKRILLVGDGARLCCDEFSRIGLSVSVSGSGFGGIRASDVALAAADSFSAAVTPDEFALNYIRPSQAERELDKKKKAVGVRTEVPADN